VPARRCDRDVEGEKNRGGGIDGHRSGNGFERDAVEQRLHVCEGIDGDANFANFAEREWMVGVHANLGGKIEGDGKTFDSLGEKVAIAFVGFGSAAESGVLAGGPQAAAIHGGIDAASEREFAGIAEIALRIEAGQIFLGYHGFHGKAGG